MPFPYLSMREAIEDWEKEGELIRVAKEVDWNLEAGAICRRCAQKGGAKSVKDGGYPALLFENIKGYPKGFRILGNPITNYKRAAMILGHPNPDKPPNELLPELQDIWEAGIARRMKPVVVKDAPCKENKAFGDEVNLYKFPAPTVHYGDGGRYLATYHLVATKDKTSDWLNWGMYRGMIHDRRSMGGIFTLPQHGPWMYYTQYEPANEPMPFAMAITADPLSLFAASCTIPRGISEMDCVGGLMGKPLEVVKCETNDLVVPASSEIVLEGVMPPKIRAYEGPFGEYTGYRASPRDLRPVYVVQAMTWRNDPILAMSVMGMFFDESHVAQSISIGAMIKRILREHGILVKAANLMPETCSTMVVVSTRVPVREYAVLIAEIIDSHIYPGLKTLVCDEDVDIFNVSEVMHAFSTKVHPVRDTYVLEGPGSPMHPYGDLEERLKMNAPHVVYDATWSLDWPPEIAVPPKSSFDTIYPKEVQEKVLANWKEYGLW